MMRKYSAVMLTVIAAALVYMAVQTRIATVQAQGKAGVAFSLFPNQKGGQDIFGPYEVVKDWPQNISTLPGNKDWTWGAGQSVYAESPNRVFILLRGELPNIKRPATKLLPEFGPSIQFPIGRLPWRDATVSALPGAGGTGQDPENGPRLWKGTVGVDAKWEHCITVVDANGNITETYPQYDHILKRPHFVTINPYDPEKHIWIVDDHMHAIYKFTHDMKELVQTIGTPTVKGADGTHFNRPTYLAWLPDGTMFVADGYNGTRVAKFDKNGKFLMDWGQKGTPPHETRAGYFNNVHGIAVDPQTRRVFVNDRGNHRIQVFDDNGKYLYEWGIGRGAVGHPSDLYRRRSQAVGLRSRNLEDAEVRSGRPLPVLLGHLGRFSRRLLGRARVQRRSGWKLLHGRGGQRARTEVPAASWREPCVPGRQAGIFGVEITL